MRSRSLVLPGAVVTAQGAARPQTTAPTVVAPIKVTLTDSAIRVSPKNAPRGALGRFILSNPGTKRHAFTLVTMKTEFGTQKGFTRTLLPGKSTVVFLYLDYRGRMAYRGALPADRTKAAMRGSIRVY